MKIEIRGFRTLDQFLGEKVYQNGEPHVSYGGKFQPFHKGHFDIYKKLCDKFGKENVFITTTDTLKYDEKHIMNFEEKKTVMTHMFNIPVNKIIKVKNNYAPNELNGMFPENTAFITVVGEKDADRLTKSGKYFTMYKDGEQLEGYRQKGYVYVEENTPGIKLSATEIRDFFRSDKSEDEKKAYFTKIYKKFDAQIFNVLLQRLQLNESQIFETDSKIKIDKLLKKYKNSYKWVNSNLEVWDKQDAKKIEDVLNSNDIKFTGPQYLFGTYYLKINENLDINFNFDTERINCGGAFGHLEHIYDDLELSFDNLRELVNLGLEGKLENSVEKTDGQALAISWKNGGLVSARNKGQYKNFGENALDYKALKDMFAGRGDIADAFSFAIDDLQEAISKLPQKEINDMFQDGKKFMHIEVMYVPTTNIVPYGINLLVFHNVTEYDESGEAIAEDRKSADKLAKMIKDVNQNVQKTFNIQGSPYIDMKAIADKDIKKSEFLKKITDLQNKYGLGNGSTLLDYYQKEWEAYLEKAPVKLTDIEKQGLITRWGAEDKSFGINGKTLSKEALEWAKEFEKGGEFKKVTTAIKRPVELLFVELAVTILRNLNTFLAANPDAAATAMKKELESTINQIKSEKDETALAKMQNQLDRLEAAGGMETIFPSEGIVFNYHGKMYKLTGTFTDVHHIISLIKYKK